MQGDCCGLMNRVDECPGDRFAGPEVRKSGSPAVLIIDLYTGSYFAAAERLGPVLASYRYRIH